MIIVELFRYLTGYINFRAFGGFADRFINLCTHDNIPLWNIRNIDGRITASTTVKGYLAIRRPARRAGMRVRAVEKKGLRFFLKKHKKRVGILAGAIASVIIVIILSQFVWSVSVVGNVTLEDEYILDVFEKYGIRVGARISTLDMREAAQQAVADIPRLSWSAVNSKGSVLVIEVRERTEIPEIYDSQTPTNVVASEDGVILSVEILYGNSEVKVGSAVTKGDLLISGIMTHSNYSETAIHADGHVKALTKKKEEFSVDDWQIFSAVNSKKRSMLFFFGIKIPLGASVPESYFSEHKAFLSNGEKMMPLGIITQHGIEFSDEAVSPNEKMQEKLALYEGAVYVKNLLEYSDVKSSKITLKEDNFGKKYEFSAECEQEIGSLQEIYLEKTNDIA